MLFLLERGSRGFLRVPDGAITTFTPTREVIVGAPVYLELKVLNKSGQTVTNTAARLLRQIGIEGDGMNSLARF